MSFMVRAGVLQGFSELVEELSGDTDKLLGSYGLSPKILQAPDSMILLESVINLLGQAAAQTHCDHFGILLVSRQNQDLAGVLGLIMKYSESLASGLRRTSKQVSLHIQGVEWKVTESAEFAYNDIHLDASLRPVMNWPALSLAVAQSVKVLQSQTESHQLPERVFFRCKPPSDVDKIREIFGCPVEFNQDRDGYRFPKFLLTQKRPIADASVVDYLLRYATSLCPSEPDLIQQTRKIITELLPEGCCNVENVASALACNSRTLQRHLKQRGYVFKDLVEAVRGDLARDYLKNSDIPITNIAYLLGYSDPSTFARAFKNTEQMSPTDFRTSHKPPAPR